MKPTQTPAYRPTASCIWNSFLSSGKRHLILTGGRGSGKTTRLDQLRAGMGGIRTHAVARDGVYLQTSPEGAKVQIGMWEATLPGPENRMRPLNDALDTQAVPLIQQLTEVAEEWAFVDEIGYLECGSAAYTNALRALFERKRVLAAVRMQNTPFLSEMRTRADAFCVDLDAPFGNAGCVIMASGDSKRFGGNKLLADFCGRPMIEYILGATDGIFARRVVVTRQTQIAEMCKQRGVDVVLHGLPYRSDTVRLGLQAVGDVDGCMFCAADQPLLRRETVASIALCAANERSMIWRARFGQTDGSPVMFPCGMFEELMDLPQGKGGGHIAQMYPACVRTVPARDETELTDVDDRETLARLERIVGEMRGDGKGET